jgi:hypothetical protein
VNGKKFYNPKVGRQRADRNVKRAERVPAGGATHPRRAAVIPAKESGAPMAVAMAWTGADTRSSEKLKAEMKRMKNRMDAMSDFGCLLSDF